MITGYPVISRYSAEFENQSMRELIAVGFPQDLQEKSGPGPIIRRTATCWKILGGIPLEICLKLEEAFPEAVASGALQFNIARLQITSDKPDYLPKVRQGASPRVFCFSAKISSIEVFRAFREEYYAHKGHLGWGFFEIST